MSDAPEVAKETAVEAPSKELLSETVAFVLRENVELREGLARVQGMFKVEDRGWEKFGPDDADGGMSREDIVEWSKQIREAIIGNPWIKSAIRLRNSYIFQDGGPRYDNIPDKSDGRSKSRNVQELIDDPLNQAHFFGQEAHKERESANFSDGNVYYLGDDNDFTLEALPLEQIDGEYRNPDNASQVWAYRRRWTPATPGAKEKVEWYFTDIYKKKALDRSNVPLKTIRSAEAEEPVVYDKTLFDGRVNTQLNFAHGVPDALAALIWARIYTDFITNGKIMTDALAQFAFQATVGSKTTGAGVGMKLAEPGAPGQTFVTGAANNLVPLSSAGKGYDFSSGTALLAAVATSIGVSVIHLSSDPGTAGSSYGSASTLDLPTLLATNDRRDWHAAFDTRVLRWMGAPDAFVYFKPLTDPASILRKIQALAALWNMGLYEGDEARAEADSIQGRKPGKAPQGVMLPNNKEFVDTLTNDGQSLPKATTTDPAADPAAAATGKGKSTGAGSNPKSNDLRTDKVSQALRDLDLGDKLDRVLELLERLEPAA